MTIEVVKNSITITEDTIIRMQAHMLYSTQIRYQMQTRMKTIKVQITIVNVIVRQSGEVTRRLSNKLWSVFLQKMMLTRSLRMETQA